jgi:copper chaperone CopZ
MRSTKWILLLGVSCLVVVCGTALALADTTVEVKDVHLCCKNCVKSVGKALNGIESVKPKCDQDAGTITITAKDDATVQKALDALAEAGFHGGTGNPKLAIKETTDVPSGKVKSLTLTGLHNCCGACTKAIKSTLKGVSGVSSDTAKPKASTFTVNGDFDAAAVVKALSDAGYHVKIQK